MEQVGIDALAQRFVLEKWLLAHALLLEMVPTQTRIQLCNSGPIFRPKAPFEATLT